MSLLFTTFHPSGVMVQSLQDSLENLLSWVPSILILLYIIIKNNAWQRTVLHIGSLLALILLHLAIYPLFGTPLLSFPVLFFSLLLSASLFMWSGRLAFTACVFLAAFYGLYTGVPIASQLLSYGVGVLLSLFLFILSLYLSKRFEIEMNRYVSGEYSKGGYLVSDISFLLIFLFLTAFGMLQKSVFDFASL